MSPGHVGGQVGWCLTLDLRAVSSNPVLGSTLLRKKEYSEFVFAFLFFLLKNRVMWDTGFPVFNSLPQMQSELANAYMSFHRR